MLVCILALGLLLAPTALADGADGKRIRGHAPDADDRRDARPEHAMRGQDDDDNRTLANATERRAAFAALLDRISTIRTSWLENATKVREACHDAEFDRANATKEEKRIHAHCMKDGYDALHKLMRAERRLAWLEFREAFHL